jgi:hypothetical protein
MPVKATDNDHLLNAAGVDKTFARKAKAVLADVRSKRPGLTVREVMRSEALQRLYYCQGRTTSQLRAAGLKILEIANARADGYVASKSIITRMIKPTYHGRGLAMDCAWVVNGRVTWNVPKEDWELYAHAGAAHGLHSLGPSIGDWGHLQLGGD